MNPKSIEIKNIVISFFVRKYLDEARVNQLIKLIEGKVDLPPIRVWFNSKTAKYEVIDGRHRLEAHKRLDFTHIQVAMVAEPDFAQRVGMAVGANSSGPLTATDEDFEVALQALLDAGVSVRRIIEVFPLPKSYTVKCIHNVKSKLYKAAVTLAVDAILNRGLTVAQAAKEYGVETTAIKERINGTRKIGKDAISDFTGGFSHRFRSFSKRNSDDCKKLIEAYDLGNLAPDAVRGIFKTVIRSARNATSALEDYQQRFEARIEVDSQGEGEKTA